MFLIRITKNLTLPYYGICLIKYIFLDTLEFSLVHVLKYGLKVLKIAIYMSII